MNIYQQLVLRGILTIVALLLVITSKLGCREEGQYLSIIRRHNVYINNYKTYIKKCRGENK